MIRLPPPLRPFAALALLLALPAAATSLLRADVPVLAAESDAVVRGTVRRVQSRWAADGQRIVTDVEIEVAEALKGAPGRRARHPAGGPRGGHRADGERARLLRARRGGGGVPQAPRPARLRGARHGAGQVPGAALGGRKKQVLAVPAPLGDARVLDRDTGAEVSPARRPLPLESLRTAVRAAAGRAPAGKRP